MRNTNSIVITVEECIRTLPIETREILQKIRKLGKKLVPESTEAVKYGMPTLQINGKSFFHFCGYKNHIGIYPATGSFEMKEMEKYFSDYKEGDIVSYEDSDFIKPLSVIEFNSTESNFFKDTIKLIFENFNIYDSYVYSIFNVDLNLI